jgi:sterol-4alpha-carboxylate 3-dehydrogenase (decarboxylating)
MVAMEAEHSTLGTVLVIGGTGCVGFALVHRLLQSPDCERVYVLTRGPSQNIHKGAIYLQGDITISSDVKRVIAEVNPRVIFHAATADSATTRSDDAFFTTNVNGTENLLSAAIENDATRAFVYTSSLDVYADPPIINASETHPLWERDSKYPPAYWRSKAVGDRLVRARNCVQLATACLRVPIVYGERHSQVVISLVTAQQKNQANMRVGVNDALVDVLDAENGANGHILAAKALLRPSLSQARVAGEAFNLSDGEPLPFWDFASMITRAAGNETEKENMKVIPTWVIVALGHITAWAYLIFSFGLIKPPSNMALPIFGLPYTDQNFFN